MSNDGGPDALATIPFTQFFRPDGRRQSVTITRPCEIRHIAAELIATGHEFHIEVLRTREISMTCFDMSLEEDIAIEVCPNGPEVLTAVDKLIQSAKEAANAAKGRYS